MSSPRTQSARTPRRNRAPLILLVAIAVLAAGVLPVCASNCCARPSAIASLHANMPCCTGSSIAPRDYVRSIQPTTLAGPLHPSLTSVVAHVVTPASPATTVLSADVPVFESSPPIYLTITQLLI